MNNRNDNDISTVNANFRSLQNQVDNLKDIVNYLLKQIGPGLDITPALKTPPKSILSSDLAAAITEKIQTISELTINVKTVAASIGAVRRLLLIQLDSHRVREYSLEDASRIESYMLDNWRAYAVESRAARLEARS